MLVSGVGIKAFSELSVECGPEGGSEEGTERSSEAGSVVGSVEVMINCSDGGPGCVMDSGPVVALRVGAKPVVSRRSEACL
jgi:hypothetical protein